MPPTDVFAGLAAAGWSVLCFVSQWMHPVALSQVLQTVSWVLSSKACQYGIGVDVHVLPKQAFDDQGWQ